MACSPKPTLRASSEPIEFDLTDLNSPTFPRSDEYDRMSIMAILTRNEAYLRKKGHFIIHDTPIIDVSPQEVQAQILVNEEFLARRQRQLLFLKYRHNRDGYRDRYLEAGAIHQEAVQALQHSVLTLSPPTPNRYANIATETDERLSTDPGAQTGPVERHRFRIPAGRRSSQPSSQSSPENLGESQVSETRGEGSATGQTRRETADRLIQVMQRRIQARARQGIDNSEITAIRDSGWQHQEMVDMATRRSIETFLGETAGRQGFRISRAPTFRRPNSQTEPSPRISSVPRPHLLALQPAPEIRGLDAPRNLNSGRQALARATRGLLERNNDLEAMQRELDRLSGDAPVADDDSSETGAQFSDEENALFADFSSVISHPPITDGETNTADVGRSAGDSPVLVSRPENESQQGELTQLFEGLSLENRNTTTTAPVAEDPDPIIAPFTFDGEDAAIVHARAMSFLQKNLAIPDSWTPQEILTFVNRRGDLLSYIRREFRPRTPRIFKITTELKSLQRAKKRDKTARAAMARLNSAGSSSTSTSGNDRSRIVRYVATKREERIKVAKKKLNALKLRARHDLRVVRIDRWYNRSRDEITWAIEYLKEEARQSRSVTRTRARATESRPQLEREHEIETDDDAVSDTESEPDSVMGEPIAHDHMKPSPETQTPPQAGSYSFQINGVWYGTPEPLADDPSQQHIPIEESWNDESEELRYDYITPSERAFILASVANPVLRQYHVSKPSRLRASLTRQPRREWPELGSWGSEWR
jgi:hypothetical protein